MLYPPNGHVRAVARARGWGSFGRWPTGKGGLTSSMWPTPFAVPANRWRRWMCSNTHRRRGWCCMRVEHDGGCLRNGEVETCMPTPGTTGTWCSLAYHRAFGTPGPRFKSWRAHQSFALESTTARLIRRCALVHIMQPVTTSLPDEPGARCGPAGERQATPPASNAMRQSHRGPSHQGRGGRPPASSTGGAR